VIRSPKTGPFRVRVFRGIFPWLGGAENDEASQFSDAQKAFVLRQGSDGVPVADICRKAGISQATYFNWKKVWSAPRRQVAIGTEPRGLHQSIRPHMTVLRSTVFLIMIRGELSSGRTSLQTSYVERPAVQGASQSISPAWTVRSYVRP